jgi:hypothetical protein
MAQTLVPTPVLRVRRVNARGRLRWSGLVVVVALLVAAPVVAILLEVGAERPDSLPAQLPHMVTTTLALMGTVALGSLVLGVGLAWLVTAYTFPLRNVFVWLLVLPLAMPAYILGFVFLSTFDAAGPVQQWVRGLGLDVQFSISVAGRLRRRHVAHALPLRLPDGAGGVRRAGPGDVRRGADARREPPAGLLPRCCCRSPALRWRRAWRW